VQGEVYFKRQIGPAWDEMIKLSRLSMERLLFAFFNANSGLEKLAEQLNEERLARWREAPQRASPVTALLPGEAGSGRVSRGPGPNGIAPQTASCPTARCTRRSRPRKR
jgi:hypothetical protein